MSYPKDDALARSLAEATERYRDHNDSVERSRGVDVRQSRITRAEREILQAARRLTEKEKKARPSEKMRLRNQYVEAAWNLHDAEKDG